MKQHKTLCEAALAVLLVLQIVMLGALFTLTAPHPPIAVPPFAIGPFLGASLSIAIVALMLGGTTTRAGSIASIIAAALALVSYGPHKWIDPAIGQIWPAVLLGQIAVVTIIVQAAASVRTASRV